MAGGSANAIGNGFGSQTDALVHPASWFQ